MRVYLAGRLAIESDAGLLEEAELPARQGRIALAYLVLHRRTPTPRIELAEAVWGEALPESWDASLSALLSRLRRLFRRVAPDSDIETVSGSVSLSLTGAWVDIEAARNAIDESEGAQRAGSHATAWSNAAVALSIAERGFLPGEDLSWVLRTREQIHGVRVRALECLAEASLALRDASAALRYANDCVRLEPYRESAYEQVMRAHVSSGNRAEALRVYDRLRSLLSDELGIDPSPGVERTYLEALRATRENPH